MSRSHPNNTDPHPAPASGPRTRYSSFRDRARANPASNTLWRCSIGVLGAVVLVAGIIMIPYPGPGWLVVFAGLAILGTEFAWAQRLLAHARHHYDRWNAWQRRQHGLLRLVLLLATTAIVMLTLWLLGAFEFAATWLGLDWPALDSPLGPLA